MLSVVDNYLTTGNAGPENKRVDVVKEKKTQSSPETVWQCDHCTSSVFDTQSEALAHEDLCRRSGKRGNPIRKKKTRERSRSSLARAMATATRITRVMSNSNSKFNRRKKLTNTNTSASSKYNQKKLNSAVSLDTSIASTVRMTSFASNISTDEEDDSDDYDDCASVSSFATSAQSIMEDSFSIVENNINNSKIDDQVLFGEEDSSHHSRRHMSSSFTKDTSQKKLTNSFSKCNLKKRSTHASSLSLDTSIASTVLMTSSFCSIDNSSIVEEEDDCASVSSFATSAQSIIEDSPDIVENDIQNSSDGKLLFGEDDSTYHHKKQVLPLHSLTQRHEAMFLVKSSNSTITRKVRASRSKRLVEQQKVRQSRKIKLESRQNRRRCRTPPALRSRLTPEKMRRSLRISHRHISTDPTKHLEDIKVGFLTDEKKDLMSGSSFSLFYSLAYGLVPDYYGSYVGDAVQRFQKKISDITGHNLCSVH